MMTPDEAIAKRMCWGSARHPGYHTPATYWWVTKRAQSNTPMFCDDCLDDMFDLTVKLPELQCRSIEPLDSAVDIYALGVRADEYQPPHHP